jgi:hypothetical protein
MSVHLNCGFSRRNFETADTRTNRTRLNPIALSTADI